MSSQGMNRKRSIPKFGVGIVCFDTAEFMRFKVKQMVGLVDYIIVAMPTRGYLGRTVPDEVSKELHAMEKEGLIKLYCYEPYLCKTVEEAKLQEVELHNRLIFMLQSLGCKYAMISHSDEIVLREDFEFIINTCIEYKPIIYFVKFRQYYKDTCWYCTGGMMRFMPTFVDTRYRISEKVHRSHSISNTRTYILPEGYRSRFEKRKILLHHLSWVRKDLRTKLMLGYRFIGLNEGHIRRVLNSYNNLKEVDGKVRVWVARQSAHGAAFYSHCERPFTLEEASLQQ